MINLVQGRRVLGASTSIYGKNPTTDMGWNVSLSTSDSIIYARTLLSPYRSTRSCVAEAADDSAASYAISVDNVLA